MQKQAETPPRECRWFDPGSSHHLALKDLDPSVANLAAGAGRTCGLRTEFEAVLLVAAGGHLVFLAGIFAVAKLWPWAVGALVLVGLVGIRVWRVLVSIAGEMRREMDEMTAGEVPVECGTFPEGVTIGADGRASYVVPRLRRSTEERGAQWPH